MKIYLAGPDVFRPDVEAWAAEAEALCARYGFEALLPVDADERDPLRIFANNVALIRKAQIVIANLDSFRGAEPDSGTAFELGFAHALNKRLFGYVRRLQTVAERVASIEGRSLPPEDPRDASGWAVENFGLPTNLMLAMSTQIIEGGLEECLHAIRSRPGGA